MAETPFFFPNGAYSLFGLFHQPESEDSRVPFVFFHPFGEEKLWTHRVFVSFARQLVGEGHPVLRFDFMGSGDSDGEFHESSLATAVADGRRAIEEVRTRTGSTRVNLLGLRLGATIASLVAEDRADIDQLILWAPIVDGARYMQDLLRINLTTQMATNKKIQQDREALVASMQRGGTVNVDGYELALPFYEEVSAVNLAAGPKQSLRPCLIAHIDRRPEPAPDLKRLASSYEKATLTTVQEEPFWKEIGRFYDQAPNLFSTTVDWMRAS